MRGKKIETSGRDCQEVEVTVSVPLRGKKIETRGKSNMLSNVSVPLRGKKIETLKFGTTPVTSTVSVPLRGKKIETECTLKTSLNNCFRPLAG